MLRAMLDSVAEGVVGVDCDGRFTMWNSGATRLLGVGETDTSSDHWAETYNLYEAGTKTLYPTQQLPLLRALRGESVDDVEMSVRRPIEDGDSDWRKISVNARPVIDEEGGIIGAVAVFPDITAFEAAETRARQREIELAHVARLGTMGELASGLAHELNQPLAAISSFVHGCRRRLADRKLNASDLDEVLGQISGQAFRAGQIIKRMREFARKRDPVRTRESLNEAAESVTSLLSVEARDRHTRIELDLPDDLPAVMGDLVELEQVVLNLMRNGIEAMADLPADQRLLRVRTEAAPKMDLPRGGSGGGPAEVLEVTDNGPGLDPTDIQRVFEPIYTTKADGLGMGLKISRTIVESHGGRLTCRNEPGGGCTFRICLPAAMPDNRADPAAESNLTAPAWPRPAI